MPEGEQGLNVARIASLRAGLPVSTSAVTANRFCASGIEAIAIAADRIGAGSARCALAGGTESMSLVPMGNLAAMLKAAQAQSSSASLAPLGRWGDERSPGDDDLVQIMLVAGARNRHYRPRYTSSRHEPPSARSATYFTPDRTRSHL
jgi:acetyl-CoA acetyltransferase